jgi:hypothetical protein
VDPISKEYPALTPYQFASNSPLAGVDRDGLELEPFTVGNAVRSNREFEADLHKKDPIHANAIIIQHNVNAFLFVGGALAGGAGTKVATAFWDLATVYFGYRTSHGLATKNDDEVREGVYGVVGIATGGVVGEVISTTFDGIPNLLRPRTNNFSKEVFDINGTPIRNLGLANQTIISKVGPVTFDEYGFPDFTPYSIKNVEIEGLTGIYKTDERMALKEANLKETPKDYVWHHHQDGKTMQLVPKVLNNPSQGGIPHSGGSAVIKHNQANPGNQIKYPSPKTN